MGRSVEPREEFLDKELQQVVQIELERPNKLVWRTGGEEAWVLIHLEVRALKKPTSLSGCLFTTTASMTVTSVESLQ